MGAGEADPAVAGVAAMLAGVKISTIGRIFTSRSWRT